MSDKYPKTILVIDDSVAERVNLRKVLEGAAINVMEAHDGENGIKAAKAQMPQLILMDVVMPGVNGFQATRAIKKDPVTAHIPIIMVTTKDRDPDRENAKDNGASGYIVKPISAQVVLSTIEKIWADRKVPA